MLQADVADDHERRKRLSFVKTPSAPRIVDVPALLAKAPEQCLISPSETSSPSCFGGASCALEVAADSGIDSRIRFHNDPKRALGGIAAAPCASHAAADHRMCSPTICCNLLI